MRVEEKILQRAVSKEFILFLSTFNRLMSTINSCFTGKSFHSVISFISDMESFYNYFYMLTLTSSTIIPMLTQEWLTYNSKYKSLFLTLPLLCTCFLYYCSDFTPPGWDVYSIFLSTKEFVCIWFNTSARKTRWHIYCCSENRFCMELTARKAGLHYFQEH